MTGSDGVQDVVSKHAGTATESCQTLNGKRITPHTLRHSTGTHARSSLSLALFVLADLLFSRSAW
jgi:integrase